MAPRTLLFPSDRHAIDRHGSDLGEWVAAAAANVARESKLEWKRVLYRLRADAIEVVTIVPARVR